MAASKSSRAVRAPARIRPKLNPKKILAHPVSKPVRRHLHQLIHTLREIEGALIVAHDALQANNEGTGVYVADLLRKQVSNRLSLEADRLAVLLGLKQHEDDIEGEEENS